MLGVTAISSKEVYCCHECVWPPLRSSRVFRGNNKHNVDTMKNLMNYDGPIFRLLFSKKSWVTETSLFVNCLAPSNSKLGVSEIISKESAANVFDSPQRAPKMFAAIFNCGTMKNWMKCRWAEFSATGFKHILGHEDIMFYMFLSPGSPCLDSLKL